MDKEDIESEMSDASSETSSVSIIKKTKKVIDPDDDDLEMSDIEEDDSDKEEGDDDEDVEPLDQEGEGNDDIVGDEQHFPEIEDEDEDEEDDENYLQKFDESLQKNIIRDHHPELQIHNSDEIEALCTIVRDENGMIIDPFHKTLPIITRYERARVLGERAKQIDAGAPIFVEVDESMIDAYLIATKEFEVKKIPFIVQRPLPDGACEYWRLRDLEIL
jgi:DNA-directed RNA polymerase subunit K/omega